MKRLILTGIAAGAVLVGLVPAEAAQGCGRGFHRGLYGHCRPNVPAVVVPVPGPVVIGTYYPHRGWWDGHRYWRHRYHWHGHWRYR